MSAEENAAGSASLSKPTGAQDYKGFVAGIFSGITKLAVGHPFDTIKVRLQTTERSQFSGPLEAVVRTVRNEGVLALYKGASPPLVGWMFMDSLLMGSMTLYRRLLNENVFNKVHYNSTSRTWDSSQPKLPVLGHAMAGMMAGWTVSFIAAPVEHIKARLQVQYAASKSERLYKGPFDCTRKIYLSHGLRGVWHGLSATMLFRSFFFVWWGTYDIFTEAFKKHTSMSLPAINFWAGGLSAQLFWLSSYPVDCVKQKIMTDELGSGQKYRHWHQAATAIYRQARWRGYWRGFLPCFLRAFPANACVGTEKRSILIC